MKCPYDNKVNACLYLDEIKPDDKTYYCPDCPHYKPRHHYYDNPIKEKSAMFGISVAFIALIVIGFTYLAMQVVKLIVSWLQ